MSLIFKIKFHGTQIEVMANDGLYMESFKKPLMPQFGMVIAGTQGSSVVYSVYGRYGGQKKLGIAPEGGVYV